jgi:hypothetical protein
VLPAAAVLPGFASSEAATAQTSFPFHNLRNRLLRPGLAQVIRGKATDDSGLRRGFDQLDGEIERWLKEQKGPA